VTADGYTRREHVRGEATYTYQLRAFAAAVLRGEPVITTPEDAVATMTVIDAVYQAAGLPLRGARG
jgi:predicted dehydrogenase